MFRKTIVHIMLILVWITAAACKGDSQGITITDQDLKVETDKMIARYQAQGMPVSDEQISELQSMVLEQLIEKELLLYAAREKKYEVADDDVQAEIDGIRLQYPSAEDFTAVLEAQGYTEDSLKEEISEYKLIQNFLDTEILAAVEIDDAATKAFYNENPQYFLQGETVTASHILVQVPEDADEATKSSAMKKIRDIRAKLAAGADFAETAMEYSEGPSGPNGGDLGTFERGQMVPAFEDAAFGLTPGEISDVVETQFGFHIIYVRDKTEEGTIDYEDAQSSIVEYLRQERGSEEIQKYLDDMKERVQVNVPDLGTGEGMEEEAS